MSMEGDTSRVKKRVLKKPRKENNNVGRITGFSQVCAERLYILLSERQKLGHIAVDGCVPVLVRVSGSHHCIQLKWKKSLELSERYIPYFPCVMHQVT